MNNGIVFVFFAVFAFNGGLIGYIMGTSEMNVAIKECEKELPRNVECKIIAVPIDKE
jgi:hypothetical protein